MKKIVLNIKWVKNKIDQVHTKTVFEMTKNLTVLQLRKNTADFISSQLNRIVTLEEVTMEIVGVDNKKIILEDFYCGAQFSVEGYYFQSIDYRNNHLTDCFIVNVSETNFN